MSRQSRHSLRHAVVACLMFSFLALAVVTTPSAREPRLSSPAGPVLLTVTGQIEFTNSDGAAAFDRAMLEALPQTRIKTSTPWTEGVSRFEGPRLRDLLTRVGARGLGVDIRGADGAVGEIAISNIVGVKVIIAMRRDGKPLGPDEGGPLRIVYPWGTDPALKDADWKDSAVQKLDQIVVR